MTDRKVDVTLNADGVKVDPQGVYDVEVSLEGVDEQQLVETIGEEAFVYHSDVAEILKHIDIEDVKDFYGMELVDNIKEEYDLVEAE